MLGLIMNLQSLECSTFGQKNIRILTVSKLELAYVKTSPDYEPSVFGVFNFWPDLFLLPNPSSLLT